MKKKLPITVVSALIVGTLSTAAFGYVLLSPARRWFNADTPRLIRVDNNGVASVTGGDPDRRQRQRNRDQLVELRRGQSGFGAVRKRRLQPGRRLQRRHLRRPAPHLHGNVPRGDAHRLLLDIDDGHVRRSHRGQDHRLRCRVQPVLQLHHPGAGKLQQRDLPDSVLAHEVGHVIGLGHSGTVLGVRPVLPHSSGQRRCQQRAVQLHARRGRWRLQAGWTDLQRQRRMLLNSCRNPARKPAVVPRGRAETAAPPHLSPTLGAHDDRHRSRPHVRRSNNPRGGSARFEQSDYYFCNAGCRGGSA